MGRFSWLVSTSVSALASVRALAGCSRSPTLWGPGTALLFVHASGYFFFLSRSLAPSRCFCSVGSVALA